MSAADAVASASRRASDAGSPPWRGGRGSSTVPPATVAGGPEGADDDPVAAQGGQRRLQPQLRTAGRAGRQPRAVEQHDAGADGRRPVQDLDVRAPADAVRLRHRLQRDVDAERRCQRRAGVEHVAALHVAALDADQAGRHAAPGHRLLHVGVVLLQRADAGLAAARRQAHAVARPQRPRPEGARDDRADAAQREDAVDGQPGPPARGPRRQSRRRRAQRRPQLVQPGPGARGDRHVRGGLQPGRAHGLLGVGRRQRRALVVHEVGLGEGDDQRPHPQQREDRQVLPRLRHDAVVAGDAQQRQVDAGRAGDHRADEALVARHVDDREAQAVAEVEHRVAELDGDAAGRSSSRRSVFVPVSASTSAVLP